jgi:hypothetical protein
MQEYLKKTDITSITNTFVDKRVEGGLKKCGVGGEGGKKLAGKSWSGGEKNDREGC